MTYYNGNKFFVGYAREDITPTVYPCGMDGENVASSAYDPMYATAIALSDGETTAILLTLDVVNISKSMFKEMIDGITEQTNVPAENIYIHSVHNHSSPMYVLAEEVKEGACVAWRLDTIKKTPLAAKKAIDDLSAAEAYVGKCNAEGLNLVRKRQYEQGADPEMQVIRFIREGKKDVILANWQAHPASSVSSKYISADFIGSFREEVEAKNNALFAYFNGANGNLNVDIDKDKERIIVVREVGFKLAQKLNAMLLDNTAMKKAKLGKIRNAAIEYPAPINPVDDKELADKVMELFEADKFSNETAQALGLESVYILRALKNRILLMRNGSTSQPIPLWALSFGDIGFGLVPYEMFDRNGMQIKRESPFEMTFVCTLVGPAGYGGYIPSGAEFGKGVYEVWVCLYKPGIGEELADGVIKLLEDTKE